MAKALTEAPALLTVHETGAGQYIIRVTDTRRRALVTGLTKLLDDATEIVLVLPNDLKVFHVGGSGNGAVAGDSGSMAADAVSDDTEGLEEAPPVTDPETLALIAKEEGKTLPGAAVEPEPPAEPAPPRTRRRAKPESIAGHPEACGRCRGSGQIEMLLDGGQPGKTSCPVCRGSGELIRYGNRR